MAYYEVRNVNKKVFFEPVSNICDGIIHSLAAQTLLLLIAHN